MKTSAVIKTTAKVLVPSIIVFGLYLIINGADGIGGGFQGGAVLASAFIVHWIIHPEMRIGLKYLKMAERTIFIALLVLGMLLLGRFMSMPYMGGRVWMIAMNMAIGIKVCCGLTILFYRFIYFESR